MPPLVTHTQFSFEFSFFLRRGVGPESRGTVFDCPVGVDSPIYFIIKNKI